MKRSETKRGRPYRVLNLDARPLANAPHCVPAVPLAMVNEDRRWCLSLEEARDLAAFALAHGYHVEIVRSVDEPAPRAKAVRP
jgi:hypothetical protein